MSDIFEKTYTYTVKEIAGILKISKSKAYELIRTSTFPTIRIGKRIIIPRDGFFEWMRREVGGKILWNQNISVH